MAKISGDKAAIENGGQPAASAKAENISQPRQQSGGDGMAKTADVGKIRATA